MVWAGSRLGARAGSRPWPAAARPGLELAFLPGKSAHTDTTVQDVRNVLSMDSSGLPIIERRETYEHRPRGARCSRQSRCSNLAAQTRPSESVEKSTNIHPRRKMFVTFSTDSIGFLRASRKVRTSTPRCKMFVTFSTDSSGLPRASRKHEHPPHVARWGYFLCSVGCALRVQNQYTLEHVFCSLIACRTCF